MTIQEAIQLMKNRIETASNIVGKGADGKAFEDMEIAIQALEEVEQYRALGTVEELKEAREKQVAKKWIECPYADLIMCPSCNAEFSTIDNCTEQFDYCPKCGKRLE